MVSSATGRELSDLEKFILQHLFCRSYHSEGSNFCRSDVCDAMVERQIPPWYFSLGANPSNPSRNVESAVWLQDGERLLSPAPRQVNQALVSLAEDGYVSVHRGRRNQGVGMDLTEKGAQYVRTENLLDTQAVDQTRLKGVMERAAQCPKSIEQSLRTLQGLASDLKPRPRRAPRAALPDAPESSDEDVARAKEGVLALLNKARFSLRQKLTASDMKRKLSASTIEKSDLYATLSRARITNPFFSSPNAVQRALGALEDERMVVPSSDGKAAAYRLTEEAIGRLKQQHGGVGVCPVPENLKVTSAEQRLWQENLEKYGLGNGEYKSDPVVGAGRA